MYSQSASHFGAFVQSSDPLQGVMTCHTDSVTGLPTSGLYYKESRHPDYVTGLPTSGLYYKESGHPDYVTSVPKCAVQMKLLTGIC